MNYIKINCDLFTLNKVLTLNEIMYLSILLSFKESNKPFEYTEKQISRLLHVSKKEIEKIIYNLKRYNLIDTWKKDNEKNTYRKQARDFYKSYIYYLCSCTKDKKIIKEYLKIYIDSKYEKKTLLK